LEENNIRPTGIDSLDQMLNGGIPVGATVLLAGSPGAGKTILAMEWLFNGFEKYKEPGIYISLTEPIATATKNVRKFSFFKQEYMNPTQVYFTDMRGILQGMDMDRDLNKEDIKLIVDKIRNIVETSGAKRVVLDSITAMAYRLKDRDLIRSFIFQLGTFLSQSDTNVILTSEVVDDGYSVFGVEEFISDGIIKMVQEKVNNENIRKLKIVKMRGLDYDSHSTSFNISEDGIKLFPRLNYCLNCNVSDKRLKTGIDGLDEMTRGGYFQGSSILLTGSSGTGKTIMSLQFLIEALKAGEKCIYVSFEESRDQLVRNAKSFGWDLERHEKKTY